jgi:hypothetical protein
LSPGPDGKAGGEGKTDGDGGVGIGDLAWDVTGECLLSEPECKLGERKTPRIGDWYDGEGSVAWKSRGTAPAPRSRGFKLQDLNGSFPGASKVMESLAVSP